MGPQDGLGAFIISPTRGLVCSSYSPTYLSYVSLPPLRPCRSSKPPEPSEGIIASRLVSSLEARSRRTKELLSRMNILVATPGRLLQHMDETIGFECDKLQIYGENLYKADAIYVLNGN